MRQYELYLVIDAEVEEDDINAIVERMTQLISTGDGEIKGEVVKVEPRGRRRLTYTIKKKHNCTLHCMKLYIFFCFCKGIFYQKCCIYK